MTHIKHLSIAGFFLLLSWQGRAEPDLHELAEFYRVSPIVSAKVLGASGVDFHIARRRSGSSEVVSLELLDHNHPSRGFRFPAITNASRPFWDEILEKFPLGRSSQYVQGNRVTDEHIHAQLWNDLGNLVAIDQLDSLRLNIIEQSGGPAEKFILVTTPYPDPSAGSSGRLAAIGIPPSPVDNVLVVDPALTEGIEDVAGYISRIGHHKSDGYHVIGIGTEGIAFRKGGTYLFERYQGGAWVGSSTSNSVKADPPAWVNGLGPSRPFLASLTQETRSHVHAALAVCSESAWRVQYSYASDPAVWAVH